MTRNDQFVKELESLLNKYSIDNECETPDYILAEYLYDVLQSYQNALRSMAYRNYISAPIKEVNEAGIGIKEMIKRDPSLVQRSNFTQEHYTKLLDNIFNGVHTIADGVLALRDSIDTPITTMPHTKPDNNAK